MAAGGDGELVDEIKSEEGESTTGVVVEVSDVWVTGSGVGLEELGEVSVGFGDWCVGTREDCIGGADGFWGGVIENVGINKLDEFGWGNRCNAGGKQSGIGES